MMIQQYGEWSFLSGRFLFFNNRFEYKQNFDKVLIILEGNKISYVTGFLTMISQYPQTQEEKYQCSELNFRILYSVRGERDILCLDMLRQIHETNQGRVRITCHDKFCKNRSESSIYTKNGDNISSLLDSTISIIHKDEDQFNCEEVYEMSFLPYEDTQVIVSVEDENKIKVRDILLGMNFKQDHIINL